MNAPAIVADLKQAVTDFENYFMNVFKDPGQFVQLTIVAVLQEVKDLLFTLLDLLDGLAQVFLDVVEQMLGIMNGWFNQHLDIPVISPLYKFITGLLGTSESLTILHLFALLTGVPLTIIHKLIFNGQKPYDGIDVAGLRPSVGRAPAGASEPEAAKWNQAYLVTGSAYTGVVTLLDALIVAQRPADPPIPPTPPIRIATSFSRSLADILALVQRINCWPGMFPNLPHPENATAGWLLANWCIYWFPPMVDAAFNPTDVPEVRISCLIVLGIAASVSAGRHGFSKRLHRRPDRHPTLALDPVVHDVGGSADPCDRLDRRPRRLRLSQTGGRHVDQSGSHDVALRRQSRQLIGCEPTQLLFLGLGAVRFPALSFPTQPVPHLLRPKRQGLVDVIPGVE